MNQVLKRIDRALRHGLIAGAAVFAVSALGIAYLWHSARESQLDSVRSGLVQLARVAAVQIDGDLHRTLKSQDQAGSTAHLAVLAPLVKFHKATRDVIYVYTAILVKHQIYFVAGTDFLYRIPGDTVPPDPIMKPHNTPDPALRRALEQHEAAVNTEPVKETLRSYMSAYAPFYDREGQFVGVLGVDMWVKDFDAKAAAIRNSGIAALIVVSFFSLLAGFGANRLSGASQRAHRRDQVVQKELAMAKAQAELQASRAEDALKAKSQFLAMLTHEIRTPMNGVVGSAGLLRDTSLNPQQREFLAGIQRSGDALLALINDVLDYSKIEAGQMTVESIDFNLRSACLEVQRLMRPAAEQRRLLLTLDYPADVSALAKGDAARVRQVLLNLVSNAIKFTEHGGVRIDVQELADTYVRITVSDTGIGIAPELRARLFERFQHEEASNISRYARTGLGLAISRSLVELMRGEIGYVRRDEGGSTFWFTVRLVESKAATADSRASDTRAAG